MKLGELTTLEDLNFLGKKILFGELTTLEDLNFVCKKLVELGDFTIIFETQTQSRAQNLIFLSCYFFN